VTSRRSVLGLGVVLFCCSCGGGLSTKGLGDAGADGDASAAATSLRDGLAGAWSFDVDGKDHGGHALDLEIAGLHLATGRFGKGLQFGGDGTPIAQRPVDDPSLNLATGDFTVSFWIDFAMTASAQFVAVKGYTEGGWFVGWARTVWAYSLSGSTGGGTLAPPATPPPGSFHHVVLERTGDTIELFVDSTSVGTAALTDSPTVAKAPFQVGGYAAGGVTVAQGGSVVNGVVDDLAIWHRALVPEERDYLATHPVP
jgi:Concanavalin A-like lectin/glucanases superfamily